MKYKLKDVCNFYSGTGFPTKYQGEIEGDYPFYKVGDITNNVIAGNIYLEMCNNYVSIDTVKKIKGCVLPPNTVVFAKIGEALKLNRRAITSCACLIDNNAMGIAPKEDTLRIQYFYFFMKNLKMQVLAESTTVPSVRKTILEDYEVEIPSLNIQEEIESRLTIIQDIIEKRKKELSLLDNLIKARFVEMFGDPIINPYGFPVKKIDEVAVLNKGITYSPDDISKEGIIVLRSGNIKGNAFDLEDIVRISKKISNDKLVNENDILMCNRNGSVNLVGKVAKIPKLEEKMTFGTFMTIVRSEIFEYLFVFFQMNAFREQIKFQTAVAINQISLPLLASVKVPIPTNELIKEFADFVEQVDKSRFDIKKSITELEREVVYD